MNSNFLRILCFHFSLFAGISSAVSQEKDSVKADSKYTLMLRGNYPMPLSGATFNRIYNGIGSINVTLHHQEGRRFLWALGFEYTLLHISQKVMDVKGAMQILSSSLSAGIPFNLRKIRVIPLLGSGYSFVIFTGSDTEGNSKHAFHQQAPFVQGGLSGSYPLNGKWRIGVDCTYKLLFMHFGNKSTFESNTTSILNYGICVSYKL